MVLCYYFGAVDVFAGCVLIVMLPVGFGYGLVRVCCGVGWCFGCLWLVVGARGFCDLRCGLRLILVYVGWGWV